MLTQWLILAALVSQALGVALREDDKQRQKLAFECCNEKQIIPVAFKNIKGCFWEMTTSYYEGGLIKDKRGCELYQCLMEKANLLNADKTIKEKETKDIYLKNTKAKLVPIMEAALNMCFDKYKKNIDSFKHGECISGADRMSLCITDDMKRNCPKEFWHSKSKGRPQCPK